MRLLAAVVFALVLAAPTALLADDEDDIKIAMDKFVADWNKHDAEGMASLWAEKGDVTNPLGRKAEGRDQVKKLLTEEHTGVMKATQAKITGTPMIKMLGDDYAWVEHEFEVSGMKSPEGKMMPPMKHQVVMLLEKNDDKWEAQMARPYMFMHSMGKDMAHHSKKK